MPIRSFCILYLHVFLAGAALAQVPTEFPADAVPIDADFLRAHVLGKTFSGKLADGVALTMEFGTDGSFRGTWISDGVPRTGTGKVRMDGDKLCQDMRKALESGCNSVRWKANTLFYRRNSNGEVLTLVAQ